MANRNYNALLLACYLAILLWASSVIASLAELERNVQNLNITDHGEVELFVKEWTRPGLLKALGQPALATQLPTWELGLGRRQDLNKCFGNDNGCSEDNPQCCGTKEDGWCCPELIEAQCCKASKNGCCTGGTSCCGGRKAAGQGACCEAGQNCCDPTNGRSFCCDEDQTCDNDNGEGSCIDPTDTVTDTITSWTTETETETITTDGTTTVETVSTKETTIFVTVSRDSTDDETSVEETADSGRRLKRFLPANPAPTKLQRIHRAQETSATKSQRRVVVIRPAASLDALADALARRGVPIHRRATQTETVTETEEATTTVTETETETEWTTKYTTSVTTEKNTVTVLAYAGGKSTITVIGEAKETGEPNTDDSSQSGSDGPPKGTIIGAAVGGGLGLILIVLLAFFLWRRKKPAANPTQPPSQFYAVAGHDEAAQKPPHVLSTACSPFEQGHGARDTWMTGVSSPQNDIRRESSQPPAYHTPPPGELANTQRAYEMPSSPQQGPPQELYNRQYMSGLGLPETGDPPKG